MNAALAPAPGLVRCPSCTHWLEGPWSAGEAKDVRCGRCSSALTILSFPALDAGQPLSTQAGEQALEGEATCFFHPEKRAEIACERCGRFLCALCDLPFGSRHLCPACLSSAQGGEPLQELVYKRIVWSQVALNLALVPLVPLVSVGFFLTAPAAVFLAIHSWRRPGSLIYGRRPVISVVALLIGLAQVVGIVIIITSMWKGATHRVR